MSYLSWVASGARLGPSDLDGALAVVAEAAATEGAHPFDLPVIERLLGLIPADRGGYFEIAQTKEMSSTRSRMGPGASRGTARPRLSASGGRVHLWDGTEYAVRLSDLLTRRQRLRNPWCMEVMRPRSIEHQMKVRLPAPKGIIRGFWVERDARTAATSTNGTAQS